MPVTISGSGSITGLNLQGSNGFRLTLTSGTPVTTSDVTGAGTIYCTPYRGNVIALYTSGAWVYYSSNEFSLALSGLTSGRPYDVFCYANGGTPTLEFLAWTSDTARATALSYQDGVLVKTGDATRRYLGTFYTTGVTTTEDSDANRYLWNYYHRVRRVARVLEATDSWTYSTAAWRQSRGSTANQLNFVIGVAEDGVRAQAASILSNSTATVRTAKLAIGLDSTAGPSTGCMTGYAACTNTLFALRATWDGTPAAGRHYLAWLEYADGTDTQTWYGDAAAPTQLQCGIQGEVFA